jgi:hypothetical protein
VVEVRFNIIGGATGWEIAPTDEICWGFNTHILQRPYSVIFDMHDIEAELGEKDQTSWKVPKKERKEVLTRGLDRCERDGTTVFSLGRVGKNCIPYPLEEVKREFSSFRFKGDYFSCGVSYAIALAIYQGATRIDLWGMFLTNKGEYAYQKPSIEFWIGVAIGRGIEVKIHGRSHLLVNKNGRLYGYNTKQGK